MSKYAMGLLVVALLGMVAASQAAELPIDRTTDEILQQAFPFTDVCKAECRIRFHHLGMVVTASSVAFEADGRVKLADCAIVRYGKDGDGKLRQATTIRSERAHFRLARPARSFSDLSRFKILAIDLAGGVSLKIDAQ
jgi:hypothetical protein